MRAALLLAAALPVHASLSIVAPLSWHSPGRDPYTGTPAAALLRAEFERRVSEAAQAWRDAA